jgi:hypothetical protein
VTSVAAVHHLVRGLSLCKGRSRARWRVCAVIACRAERPVCEQQKARRMHEQSKEAIDI